MDSVLERIGSRARHSLKGLDPLLFGTVLALLIFGLVMVYSASFIFAQERTGDGYAFITRQFFIAVVGVLGMLGVSMVPHEKFKQYAYPILGVATLMLLAVMIPGIGARAGGAQRWVSLGFMNFQPGEFAKFAVIVFVAFQLDRKSNRLHKVAAGMLSPFLASIPALALLLLQPDFGTTVMIAMITFLMMFVAGVPIKFLGTALAFLIAAGGALIAAAPYRMARLMTFLDPWADPSGKGFQVIQSLIGFHNGQLTGAGLGNGKEKLFYLPEAHNDFIFAVIGEELGFLGVVGLVSAYLYLIYRGLRIATDCWRHHNDRFGLLLATGITLALGLQGFVNMGVVLGLLPTKGLTLPLVSYGGSALLVDLLAVGVLMSVARTREKV
jgi:cell division protein FtsW